MSADVAAAATSHWPDLRQLADLPGPEWRLAVQRADALCLVRAFEHFVETVWVVNDGLVAVNRRPIAGRSVRHIAVENYAGSLDAAVDLLRTPPRWDDVDTGAEPARPDSPGLPWTGSLSSPGGSPCP